jgi:hypothetical protein
MRAVEYQNSKANLGLKNALLEDQSGKISHIWSRDIGGLYCGFLPGTNLVLETTGRILEAFGVSK